MDVPKLCGAEEVLSRCISDVVTSLDFSWDHYFSVTGAQPSPLSCFKHLCRVEDADVEEGDTVEVPTNNGGSRWPAEIVLSCGRLVRLHYVGASSSDHDFWIDVKLADVRPSGYSKAHDVELVPPPGIPAEVSTAFLTITTDDDEEDSVLDHQDETSLIPLVDRFAPGRWLEVLSEQNPVIGWPAKIVKNVGGLLQLRYFTAVRGGDSDDIMAENKATFWLHCLCQRVRPLGFVDRSLLGDGNEFASGYRYQLRGRQCDNGALHSALVGISQEDCVPESAFKAQRPLLQHDVEIGYGIEIVDPKTRQHFRAGIISEILNDDWFAIEVDGVRVSLNRSSPFVVPVGFCRRHGIPLKPPTGDGEFEWSSFFRENGGKAAQIEAYKNHEPIGCRLTKGSKLEAINPWDSSEFCAATVIRVVSPLVWLHIDGFQSFAPVIYDLRNFDLYPCGWAEENGFGFRPPKWDPSEPELLSPALPKFRAARLSLTGHIYSPYMPSYLLPDSCPWCPAVHFNPWCYLGPYLGRPRFLSLPQAVGPGPLSFVVKKVLCVLLSASIRPRDMLAELQPEQGLSTVDRESITIKARIRSKRYTGVVESCNRLSQLPQFFRNVCIQLQACPSLIAFIEPARKCPDNCQQYAKYTETRSSSTSLVVRKRKRPSILATPLDIGPQMVTRAAKYPKLVDLEHRKPHRAVDDDSRSLTGLPAVSAAPEGVTKTDTKRLHATAAVRKTPCSQRQSKIEINGNARGRRELPRSQKPSALSGGSKSVARSIRAAAARSASLSRNRSLYNGYPGPSSGLALADDAKRLLELDRLNVDVNIPVVDSNPLCWSSSHLVQYLNRTEAACMAQLLQDEEFDGQAFLLLTLDAAIEHLQLSLGSAVKLCSIVEKLRQNCLRQRGFGCNSSLIGTNGLNWPEAS